MPANYVAARGVSISAYTPNAPALLAPAVNALLDVDYYHRLRHARRPTRPVAERRNAKCRQPKSLIVRQLA